MADDRDNRDEHASEAGAGTGGASAYRSGRVTPKKTASPRASAPAAAAPATKRSSGRVTPKKVPAPRGRYTPPVPKELKESPRWVPIAMAVLLASGFLMIFLNYLELVPGRQASNMYLLGGLGLITAGFIVATRWR